MKKLIVIGTLLMSMGCKQRYDKDIWMQNEHQNADNPRFEMTEDLTKNYLHKGMKPLQVLDLLGRPQFMDTNELGIHWTYPIGSNPGFHIDPYYLEIDFDTTGNLAATHIIEH